MAEPTNSGRRRARERIGADQARVWARELDLRNPYAKAILLALANYMNEDGSAWPGTATIARDTDISEDTVVRRLRWLEEIGAIALFKRWLDENGRPNHDGRGKPTSNEIRFLFDADRDEIEARARGETTVPDSADVSPRPQRELNSEPESVSPRVAPDQPPQSSGAHIDDLNLEGEDSPQSPPLPCGETAGSAKEASEVEPQRDEADDGLKKFKATYPIPSNRPEIVATAWAALAPLERQQLQRGAEGCRAVHDQAHRERRKHAFVDPAKFIGNPALWAEYERFAPPKPPPVVSVVAGSAEWRAIAVMRAVCGLRMPDPERFDDGTLGIRMRGPLPAGAESVAPLAPIDGPIDRDSWLIIRERDDAGKINPQFVAWSDRVFEWLGRRPEVERIETGTMRTLKKLDGTAFEVPDRVNGLRVPTEWPPGKNAGAGAIPALTDQDSSELANL